MSVVLVLALALPVAGAVLAAGARTPERLDRVLVVTVSSAAAAWAVVARSPDPLELGRIRPDELGPVLAAGVALGLLGLVGRARFDPVAGAGALGAVAVLAALANLGTDPTSPLASAVAPGTGAVAAFAAVGGAMGAVLLWRAAEGSGSVGVLVATVALVAAALVADGGPLPDGAVLFVAVAPSVAFMSLRVESGPVIVTTVMVLAAVARLTALGADPETARPAAVLAAALAVTGAVAATVWSRGRADTLFAPVPSIATALLLVPDVPGTRGAGLLLGAGAVLALVARRPLGGLALLPGASAATVVLARADGETALLVLVLGVATATTPLVVVPRTRWSRPATRSTLPALAIAVTFAVVPFGWSWAGAPGVDGMGRAAVVALAAGLIGAVAAQNLEVSRADRSTVLAGSLDRSADTAAEPPHP